MEGPITRNEIVGIADEGLVLRIDGRSETAPWSTITAVSAVLALKNCDSDRRIPVLVFGIMAEVETEERVFIVGESEPLWGPLVAALPVSPLETPPFEVWSAELAASGKASLYSRPGSAQ